MTPEVQKALGASLVQRHFHNREQERAAAAETIADAVRVGPALRARLDQIAKD